MAAVASSPLEVTRVGSPVSPAGRFTETGPVDQLDFGVEDTRPSGEIVWGRTREIAEIFAYFYSRGTRLDYWVEEPARFSVEAPVEKQPRTRDEELQWLDKNRDKIAQRYGGQWIVLEGQKLISHGHDAATVLSQARAKGIRVPFLLRIPSKDEGPLALEANHV